MTAPVALVVERPQTHEEQLAKVHTALSELNDLSSWRSIESYFEERGIRGAIANSVACPVARYVLVTTGIQIVIDGCHWWLFDGSDPLCVPERVGRFIRDFDLGYFPELKLPDPVVVPAWIEEAGRD